jgi:hypothetical protein
MTAPGVCSVGLSEVHISPQSTGWERGLRPLWDRRQADAERRSDSLRVYDVCTVEVWGEGAFVRVAAGASLPPHIIGGDRTAVMRMSAASRRRLLLLCARLRVASVHDSVFVTLTYPMRFPTPSMAKVHLDVWVKRLRREFPGVSGVWRLEPQRRGAPHFHLLLFGARFIAREWLSSTWYAVCATGDEKHLRAGTKVERPERVESLISYIGKELTGEKPGHFIDCDTGEILASGRCWGVVNREGLPISTIERIVVPVHARDLMLRLWGQVVGFESLDGYPLTRACQLATNEVTKLRDLAYQVGGVEEDE